MPGRPSRPPLVRALGVAVVVFLLSASSSLGGIRASSTVQGSQGPANWVGPDGNYPFNWDYSPQTAINLTSVNDLGLKWLFPLPGPRIQSTLGSSVIVTPIIVQGAVYYITSSDTLMAQDASS
ncbi:MAG TPA: hypothetical protein VGS04_03985, partial [Nitrososphaerales archaeon]|nr:hypothetical protein [Nitrososphaerales archaeon]